MPREIRTALRFHGYPIGRRFTSLAAVSWLSVNRCGESGILETRLGQVPSRPELHSYLLRPREHTLRHATLGAVSRRVAMERWIDTIRQVGPADVTSASSRRNHDKKYPSSPIKPIRHASCCLSSLSRWMRTIRSRGSSATAAPIRSYISIEADRSSNIRRGANDCEHCTVQARRIMRCGCPRIAVRIGNASRRIRDSLPAISRR
jgi:hypothetical protein